MHRFCNGSNPERGNGRNCAWAVNCHKRANRSVPGSREEESYTGGKQLIIHHWTVNPTKSPPDGAIFQFFVRPSFHVHRIKGFQLVSLDRRPTT